MNRETELAFWQESREQWAAILESPDEGDRDVLLSHKWARMEHPQNMGRRDPARKPHRHIRTHNPRTQRH